MNSLQLLYPGDQIASFLIRVLTEVTMVTSFVLVANRTVAKNNSPIRHGLCVCALVCVFLAPIITLGLQHLGWSTFQITLSHDQSLVASQGPYQSFSHARLQSEVRPFWTVERVRSLVGFILGLWTIGTCFFVVRLFNGWMKVDRLRRQSQHHEHVRLQSILDKLNQRYHFPTVPVRISDRLDAPVVVGAFQPVVLLPSRLLNQLEEHELASVLTHELTHVRQRDPLVGLIQRLVEATYWPHPLVHGMNRDLIRAREEVCDNVALHGTTARHYANTLLTVALGMPSNAPLDGTIGLMAPPWKLEERVKGLLDPRRRLNTTMNVRQTALIALALVSVSVLVAGTRVVAAPLPAPVLARVQDTVELDGHYNKKSHTIEYVTKASHSSPKPSQLKQVKFLVSQSPKHDNKQGFKMTVAKPNNVKNESPAVQILRYQGVADIQFDREPEKTQKFETVTITEDSSQPRVLNREISPDQVSTLLEVVKNSDKQKKDGVTNTQVLKLLSKAASDQHINVTSSRPFNVDVSQVKSSDANADVLVQGLSEAVRTFDVKLLQGTPGGTFRLETVKGEVIPIPELRYTQSDSRSDKVPQFIYHSAKTFDVKEFDRPKPSKPTTVYVDGSKIRIVGDNVKIVYVNSKASKPATKTKKLGHKQ